MAKVRKLYTLDEAAEVIGVTRAEVESSLPRYAPDFARRNNKKLAQDEVDCIAAVLGKKN